jgi:UDP-N-acetylmuramate--alanine ligase
MRKKKIHFVGIKGVGVAPLAIIAKEAGFTVSGCDIEEEFITDESLSKAGIIPQVGFDPLHVKGIDLVITTGAHGGFDNPEVKEAKKIGIDIWTQGEAVGEFMSGEIFGKALEGVSVAGSHGKTTTTAMIATILSTSGLDPSFLIGTANAASLPNAGHFGKGNIFVAEADEYSTEPKYDKTPKFLWQKPNILVITNIELDHPDLFDNIEQLSGEFLKFAKQIDGKVVACLDDPQVRKLRKEVGEKMITYGFAKDADFVVKKISPNKDGLFFWVENKGTSIGEFMLNVTGEHNALNALAAVITCIELGVSIEAIKKGLISFKGTKRRFEFIKELETGALLFDDYAHHPTEIDKTLLAFKQSYPDKKILCIFQPHTYSRTKKLFEQFSKSFDKADRTVFADIYSSLREEKDLSVSSEMLCNSLKQRGKESYYFPKLSNVVEYVVSQNLDSNWLVVTMGAGDIYKIKDSLS